MKKIFIVVLSISFVSLLSFVILSKYEDRQVMRNLDFAVTTKIQDRIDKSSHLRAQSFVENTMEGATFFASPEFTVVVTLIFFGFALYDRKKKQWNWKAIIIPVALIVIVLLEVIGKSIVHHPSPPFSMIKHTTTIFPANYINEQFSYPSGHAARAVFLGIILYSVFKSNKRKILIAVGIIGYILLVATSRIYLGHHWFSDVFGGLLIGTSLGSLISFALW